MSVFNEEDECDQSPKSERLRRDSISDALHVLERKYGKFPYDRQRIDYYSQEALPTYVAMSQKEFESIIEKLHLQNVANSAADTDSLASAPLPWHKVALYYHEQERLKEIRDNTFMRRGLETFCPTTYGVKWETLMALYQQLLDLGYSDAKKEEQLCAGLLHYIVWVAGVFYGVQILKADPNKYVDSTLDPRADIIQEFCRSGSTKFNNLLQKEMKSSAKDGGYQNTIWMYALISFIDLRSSCKDVFPKNVIDFLNTPPLKENRLRFYFGLGVEASLGPSGNILLKRIRDPLIIPGPAKNKESVGEEVKKIVQKTFEVKPTSQSAH